jgi:hypothetical protein
MFQKPPKNEEELIELNINLTNIEQNNQHILTQINKISLLIQKVENSFLTIPENFYDRFFNLYTWPSKHKKIMARSKKIAEI